MKGPPNERHPGPCPVLSRVSDVSAEITLECGHLLTLTHECGALELALTDAHGQPVARAPLVGGDIQALRGLLGMLQDELRVPRPVPYQWRDSEQRRGPGP